MKKKRQKAKTMHNNTGITLIALVVTIVVLIILATISINLVMNSNIIGKAEKSSGIQEKAAELERLELIKGSVAIEYKGKVTVDNYMKVAIKDGVVEGVESPEELEAKNEDGSQDFVTDKGWGVNVAPDPENPNNVIITIEGEKGKLPPRITKLQLVTDVNSITVNVLEVKRAEGAKYKYYYKTGNEEYTLVQNKDGIGETGETTEKSITITGLRENVRYTIKVEAINEYGSTEKTATGRTGPVPDANGTIEFSNEQWSEGKASITVTTTIETDLEIQYRINDGEYQVIANGETISNINNGETVEARFWDKEEKVGGEPKQLKIEDIEAPTVIFPDLSNVMETGSTVNIKLEDNRSGVNIKKCKWIINTTSGNIGTEESSYTGGTFNNVTQNIALPKTAGIYYLHILTVDKVGNREETVSGKITVRQLVTTITTTNHGNILAIDSKGETLTVPGGFKYVTGTTVDRGIVIEDGSSNQFVWIPMASNSDFPADPNEPLTSGGYPDEKTDYDTMKRQVLKHGGFYIGRYEAGVNTTAMRTRETTAQTVVCKAGVAPYNWVRWGESSSNIGTRGAVYLAKCMYQNDSYVTSTLCYNCQWKAMCTFIGDSSRKTPAKSAPGLTGSVSTDISKNIYDLAGNCYEWVMMGTSSSRVARGGGYNTPNPIYASFGSSAEFNYVDTTFRCTLYIKD